MDDEDRHEFIGVLSHVVENINWMSHAYCRMTNYYHLLIETPETNPERVPDFRTRG